MPGIATAPTVSWSMSCAATPKPMPAQVPYTMPSIVPLTSSHPRRWPYAIRMPMPAPMASSLPKATNAANRLVDRRTEGGRPMSSSAATKPPSAKSRSIAHKGSFSFASTKRTMNR